MFRLTKEFRFEAAHRLLNHSGHCFALHGHSYVCRIFVQSECLIPSGSSAGMVMDFADIKKPVDRLLEDYLDHHDLNETTRLENPTSEELARWIFNRLKVDIPLMVAVEIDETCTASCRYRPRKASKSDDHG